MITNNDKNNLSNKKERQPNTEYILSLSYGKDSIAALEAITQLGYPLDRIVHAEVWATNDIEADLPPMVEFKKYADKVIKERYGYEVEHIYATRKGEKLSYEKQFYITRRNKKTNSDKIYGFPITRGAWCNSRLKIAALSSIKSKDKNIKTIEYLGIASDEPERIERHARDGIVLPLVDINWDEAYCRKWCEENNLLSPIYTDSARGGCWFCHNQGVDQLRLLRKKYPDLWKYMLKWDLDSPTVFKPDEHTVHDYEKRFQAEDDGLIKAGDRKFRWKQVLEEN